MAEVLLCGKDLVFEKTPSKRILSDVSITVEKGDRLAIIGPNGAGKSTLLRVLAGAARPKSGSVFLLGCPVSSFRPLERARLIAIVGQNDRYDRRLKVWDYVSLGRIPYSMRQSCLEEKRIIEDTLYVVGLSSLANREIGSLSGGEGQRAQIARALAQKPHLLFLDEPTNHLDLQAQATLLALVAKLNLTVIIVLHDLHLVSEFATDIAILKKGRLVSYTTSEEGRLDCSVIRDVFGVDLFHIPHPYEKRMLTFFDIPISI